MKPRILIFLSIFIISVSCKKLYKPEIDAIGKVLVVDGGVTNDPPPYSIRLSYAAPYDSTGSLPVTSADVSISDDLNHQYELVNNGNGYYITKASDFTGEPGRTYTLHIQTQEGDIYESTPQMLMASKEPDDVFGVYGTTQILEEDAYHQSYITTIHGANIYVNVENSSDSLPRYRYTSSVMKEYIIEKRASPEKIVRFFGWATVNANSDINITNEPYATGSKSIEKHQVCFIDDNKQIYTEDIEPYLIAPNVYTGKLSQDVAVNVPIHMRVVYLKQYRITEEAFNYYKMIEQQLKASDRIFDPTAVQLLGNIKCINNSGKIVLGFFEASSVTYNAYRVKLTTHSIPPDITKIPYKFPTSSVGFTTDIPPDFWVD